MSACKAFGLILADLADLPEQSTALSWHGPQDVRDVAAALERARVVGALDAWAADGHGREWAIRIANVGEPWCVMRQNGLLLSSLSRRGDSPDAARAAAAKAIEAGEV